MTIIKGINMEEQELNQQPADTTQQPAPELTINDLQNIRTIIDVASRRGAFGAAEMTGVGTTFDRLNTFLNAVAPAPASDASTQPPSA
jgi:hypothetical protein